MKSQPKTSRQTIYLRSNQSVPPVHGCVRFPPSFFPDPSIQVQLHSIGTHPPPSPSPSPPQPSDRSDGVRGHASHILTASCHAAINNFFPLSPTCYIYKDYHTNLVVTYTSPPSQSPLYCMPTRSPPTLLAAAARHCCFVLVYAAAAAL